MSGIKFVDDLPEPNPSGYPGKRPIDLLREALAERPGQWAEVRREPRERVSHARARAVYIRKQGIEATTRMVGDECIVFARVPAEADQ